MSFKNLANQVRKANVERNIASANLLSAAVERFGGEEIRFKASLDDRDPGVIVTMIGEYEVSASKFLDADKREVKSSMDRLKGNETEMTEILEELSDVGGFDSPDQIAAFLVEHRMEIDEFEEIVIALLSLPVDTIPGSLMD